MAKLKIFFMSYGEVDRITMRLIIDKFVQEAF